MGILKLKNSVIVAVLLSVSNGYCANGTLGQKNNDDDSVSPKPRVRFQTPPLEREDAGLVGKKTEYAIALDKLCKLEQHSTISRKLSMLNITEAFQALQPAKLAPTRRPASTFLGDNHDEFETEYARALDKLLDLAQLSEISRKRSKRNITEAFQALQPANLAPTISPVSTFLGDGSDSSDSESDELERDASPIAESPTTPSTPSSLGGSSDTDSTYVSDSDDEEPKKRGFISSVLQWFFSWWK